MLYAFLALCLVGSARALFYQTQQNKCPNLEVQPDFNISKYLGKWYFTAEYEPLTYCITHDYSAGENGTIKVDHTTYEHLTSGSPSHTQGVLHLPDASVPAKLAINFSADDYPYWVLKTDYVSFAVIFDCSESEEESVQMTWILTREQNLTAAVITEVDAVLAKNKILQTSYKQLNPLCK